MPEPLGHERDIDPGGEQCAREAVPEVVQPDPAHSGFVAQFGEVLGHRIRRERRAVLAGEHEPVIGVGVAPLCPLGVLAQPVLEQHAERQLRHLYSAVLAASRLDLVEPAAAVPVRAVRALVRAGFVGELAAHDEHARGQVDVVPSQAERLAPA